MKTFVVLCAAAMSAIVASTNATAQAVSHSSASAIPRTLPVRGVAYDSIRRQPLRDAFVSILGTGAGARNTTTDSDGRFYFDSIPPGDYTFAIQHAVLDSLGLSGVSRKATVGNEDEEVRLGVPSFATLWRIECRGLRVPKDSGFVFGTVRDATTMRPLAHAKVEVTWVELRAKSGHVVGRRWTAEGFADDSGNYSVCDIPIWEAMSIRASGTSAKDSTSSGEIELAPRAGRIERRDLLVGPTDSVASHVGTVSGIVTNVNGEPFGAARVSMPGLREVRSDADGRFVLHDVPIGTQQIEVLSVGVSPVSQTIDVMPHDTTRVALQFGRPIVLKGMRTTATPGVHVMAQEFDARRKGGAGYMLDSTSIAHYPDFINVFNDVPGIRMVRRLGQVALTTTNDKGVACSPTLLMDGIETSGNALSDLQSHEVAAVEVYARPLMVPAELIPPGRPNECGMVVVWTKYTFRNR
ncbi:MAG TPA: carboxypeptidase regulatory-like domain-containing protein [Gemmatimonadaceae bacterium]|jgi:hypothetical protein|nr:carboxypeptidase regulatory-like domain-containing protein [Gemmatimonadaceae bacterium]